MFLVFDPAVMLPIVRLSGPSGLCLEVNRSWTVNELSNAVQEASFMCVTASHLKALVKMSSSLPASMGGQQCPS